MTEAPNRDVAQLLVPALRWNAAARRYDCEGGTLDAALDLGVGGFCVFGGPAGAARDAIADLRVRSRVSLLVAADMERGAGQQFEGLTQLPPLAALGDLGDEDVVRRAARLTAREARALGVSWVFAPVVDLDVEPQNPILGTRSFGADAERVAALARAWVEGCQAERVLACAKHFPGHGRTCEDSHSVLPEVTASRELLEHTDLVPFRAVVQARVASIMTAHVSYPAFESERFPATLSRRILLTLLRHTFEYTGLIVTDALIREGARRTEGDIGSAVRALNAGCDLLFRPADLAAAHGALVVALEHGALAAEHVRQSLERRRDWVAWAEAGTPDGAPDDDRDWATALRSRVIHLVRGAVPSLAAPLEVLVVDDDAGGQTPTRSREPLLAELAARGLEPRRVSRPAAEARSPLLIALFGETHPGKGRAGYSDATRVAVRDAVAGARATGRATVVLLFGHPRLANTIDASDIVCAWGGDEGMQRAAGAWVVEGAGLRV